MKNKNLKSLYRVQLTRKDEAGFLGNRVIWVRHFKAFSNCVRRCTELAVLEALPLDVFEISSNVTGRLFGIIKVHAGGRIEVNYTDSAENINNFVREYAWTCFQARPALPSKILI